MPTTLRDASWDRIEQLRAESVEGQAGASSVAAAGQRFATAFAATFSTVVLARMFLVAPLRALPDAERAWAEQFATRVDRPVPLDPSTPVLCLLGTAGVDPGWGQRERSNGHRAIPLIDKAMVEGAPMIAELLASLKIDLASLHGGAAVQLRAMAGGLNRRFFVPDARATVDARGRQIIAASDFVTRHDVRTVFGMGGTYLNGMIAIAIVFTSEALDAQVVDRFSSFIGTFKIATSELVAAGALLPP